MRDTILQQLNAEYEQRRMADREEETRRRREAERKIPELSDVLRARQELVFGGVRGILEGKASYEDLPAKMDVLNRQVTRLLERHGYPKDWLEPVCVCPRCHDTGYVGEPIREMCSCMRGAYYERLYAQVGLPDAGNECFERFDLSLFPEKPVPGMSISQRKLMQVTRDECSRWAHEHPYGKTRDLVLSGKSGLGKTYLMHCMAKVLLERDRNVLLISAYRFLDIARKAYFGRDGQEDGLQPLLECDVLMLDDLGTEPMLANITVEQLFDLLNERQIAGRSTVISTNLNEKELRERYTERVASRLLDKRSCTFIPFAGDDIRRT